MRIAILPGRGGSERIRDKNIVSFLGRPLIAYPLAAAARCHLFDVIHVSTESPRIAEVAASLGHPVDFLRDEDLARNQVALFDVLAWVVAEYGRRGRTFSEVCLIYPAQPLLEAADLRAGRDLFVAHGMDLPVVSVGRFPTPIERAMTIGGDGTLSWKRPDQQFVHSQDLPSAYYDCAAFMFMTPGHLEGDHGTVFRVMRPYMMPLWRTADINDPEDMAFAEVLYRGLDGSREGKV